MSKVYELLTKAQSLISDPSHWTKGTFARNKDGEPRMDDEADATCWCSMGALRKVTSAGITQEYPRAIIILSQAADEHIVKFNDSHTHAEVMAVWDKARDLAEKEKQG